MEKRKAISKRIRFEVFKRDSFTCQYCGKSAPDVILEVDHIEPVSKGGTNDITNLITSCKDCNRGKAARRISDDSVIKKSKKELDKLNKKREQLEMMMEWKKELMEVEEKNFKFVCDYIEKITKYSLKSYEKNDLKKLVGQYELDIIIKAVDSLARKLKVDEEGFYTDESLEKFFDNIPKYCFVLKSSKDKPWMKDIYYVKGIIRNRINRGEFSDNDSGCLGDRGYEIDFEEEAKKLLKLLEKGCEKGFDIKEFMEDVKKEDSLLYLSAYLSFCLKKDGYI